MISTLLQRIATDGLFQGYAYSYPHKMAYRRFTPPKQLACVWQHEERHALFLYAHIPFCGMRCGFCNLFTITQHGAAERETRLETAYLDALERQTEAVAEFLPGAAFARGAIGGGTPTLLTIPGLERLFGLWEGLTQRQPMPLSVEMSPETVTAEKLAFLRQHGTTRASMGVQSFLVAETKALGRPQKPAVVDSAITELMQAGFPVVNLDLIYGTPGQTLASWQLSLTRIVEIFPQEIFLYPLYIRPLTGLGRQERHASEEQAKLYRQGRDFLLSAGYRQVSMRLFRSPQHPEAMESSGPEYCCQQDGMLGLGAGARSYTRRVHYSTEWAVGRESVSAILQDFIQRDSQALRQTDYGCELSVAEERRRDVIKSLLRLPGLDLPRYSARFGSSALEDFPQLAALVDVQAATLQQDTLCLTQLGLEWSDVLGPWLYSEEMNGRTEAFPMR